MTEYCSSADVKKRATVNGWRYLTDRDHDGQTNSTESGEIDAAIQWAGTLLDELVCSFIEPEDARAQANRWLRDRAIDLAIHRLFSNGGDDVPESIQKAFDEASEAMERVRKGESRIPSLTYVYGQPSGVTTKVPRAYIPR
jgi:hypothetical protein